ncbi:MAG: DUF3568 family protein [Phycisphaerae bacterium]|nr:DUF3568 family protein [Phycisphaerae bacterium]
MKTTFNVGVCVLSIMMAACSGSTKTGNPYTLKADRELEAYLPGDLRKVHTAAEKVLKEKFRYKITRSGADRREGIIEGKTTKGDTVRVETYRSTEKVTRTEVFVGPMGDEEAMRDILEEITQALR